MHNEGLMRLEKSTAAMNLSSVTHHLTIGWVLLFVACTAIANSFLPSSRISASGKYEVSLTSADDKAAIGQFHEWLLVIRERNSGVVMEAEKIEFSGEMPAHGHGLPTTPEFSRYEQDRGHIIEGVKFNMGGLWKLTVKFTLMDSASASFDSAEILVAIGTRVNETRSVTEKTKWTQSELQILKTLALPVTNQPVDPSSAVSDNKLASLWGRALFFDAELSRSGSIACSTCHQPDRYFTDGLPLAKGREQLTRNTPTLIGAPYQSWFYWDGRRDSLWSQALVPMEASAEMNNSRTQVATTVKQKYQREYEALFGRLPDLPDPGIDASPMGTDSQKQRWQKLSIKQRSNVNRVFSNTGKAIAAYESLLIPAPGKFDLFVNALVQEKYAAAQSILTQSQQNGLRLFISNRAQCLNCHNTPLFSNGGFHNLGTSTNDQGDIDSGRAFGVTMALLSEFNCRSEYNDDMTASCPHLEYLSPEGHDGRNFGAFKVPTLRGLEKSAPYFHDGRFDSLEAVIDFYASDQLPVSGSHSELPVIVDFTESEKQQMVDFLRTLGTSIDIHSDWLKAP